MLIGLLDGLAGHRRRVPPVRRRNRRTQTHLDRQPAPSARLREGPACRAGRRDRRPRLPPRLSDDGRSPTRGRRVVPVHRLPAARPSRCPPRARSIPLAFLKTLVHDRASAPGGRSRRLRLASRGVAASPHRRARHQRPLLVQLAVTAERGLLDFVTFDDALTPQRRRRAEIEPRWLAGRPDAVLVASRVAPVTRHIGLVPVATVTHTEPFHVSKAIATLDFVSHGRAGWQVRVSGSTPRSGSCSVAATSQAPTSSTRPPTPSRWSADCGTAGRTTR